MSTHSTITKVLVVCLFVAGIIVLVAYKSGAFGADNLKQILTEAGKMDAPIDTPQVKTDTIVTQFELKPIGGYQEKPVPQIEITLSEEEKKRIEMMVSSKSGRVFDDTPILVIKHGNTQPVAKPMNHYLPDTSQFSNWGIKGLQAKEDEEEKKRINMMMSSKVGLVDPVILINPENFLVLSDSLKGALQVDSLRKDSTSVKPK